MTEPSRPSPQPEMPSVVLTGPGADQNALLVIGLDTVVADLGSYSTLAFASTFGEARASLQDADPFDGHLERWLEFRMTPDDDWDEGEQALLERYAGDSSPFDADEYFGEEWDQWRPQARLRGPGRPIPRPTTGLARRRGGELPWMRTLPAEPGPRSFSAKYLPGGRPALPTAWPPTTGGSVRPPGSTSPRDCGSNATPSSKRYQYSPTPKITNPS